MARNYSELQLSSVTEKKGQISSVQTLLPRTPRPAQSSLGVTSGKKKEISGEGFGPSFPTPPTAALLLLRFGLKTGFYCGAEIINPKTHRC